MGPFNGGTTSKRSRESWFFSQRVALSLTWSWPVRACGSSRTAPDSRAASSPSRHRQATVAASPSLQVLATISDVPFHLLWLLPQPSPFLFLVALRVPVDLTFSSWIHGSDRVVDLVGLVAVGCSCRARSRLRGGGRGLASPDLDRKTPRTSWAKFCSIRVLIGVLVAACFEFFSHWFWGAEKGNRGWLLLPSSSQIWSCCYRGCLSAWSPLFFNFFGSRIASLPWAYIPEKRRQIRKFSFIASL